MRVETKKVYYCDFCRKHGLRPLTKHESRCTRNPDRECHWAYVGRFQDRPHMPAGSLRSVIEWCKNLPEVTAEAIELLRDQVDGCPACMFAALRMGRPDESPYEWHQVFDFNTEQQRFNEEQQRRDAMAAMYR